MRPALRRRTLATTALGGLAGAGCLGLVVLVDPNEAGHYPSCPLLTLTGLQCPGCGTLRAVHALAHGDLVEALDLNVLAVLLLPLAVMGWLAWVRYALGARSRPPDLPGWAAPVLAVAVPTFWLVRNLPWGAALAA